MTTTPLHDAGWNGTAKLEPALRLFDACALVAGSILGPGMFFIPAALASHIETPGITLLAWLAGAAVSLLGALCLSELAAATPAAGGPYVYLKNSFGPIAGFLYGWTLFAIIQPGSIAVLALISGDALGSIFGFGTAGRSLAAICAIVLLTIVNGLGLRAGKLVQNQFVLLRILGVLLLIVLLVSRESAGVGRAFWPQSLSPNWSGFGLSFTAILWALEGWQVLSFVSAEVEQPERNLPRALIGGTAAASVLLVLLNLASLAAFPADRLRVAGSAVQSAAADLYGTPGAGFVTILILIAGIGTLNGLILAGPRVSYAMAADGRFFRAFAHIHYRRGVPMLGLVVQGIWASIIVLADPLQTLFAWVGFTVWIFYGATAAALLVLRSRESTLPRPFRIPGYPWTPGLFVVAAALMVVYAAVSQPGHALAGILLIAAGVPLFMWFEHY
jgi:basic amino acid/polyamine antiporter, APA family